MSNEFKQKFVDSINSHLLGLAQKATADFSKENFDIELQGLKGDPIYSDFSFATAQYVLVRFMGRMSISIGRRMGEIYDKIPRIAAAAKFNLTPEQVAPKIHGLELDLCIQSNQISQIDIEHLNSVCEKYLKEGIKGGVGIEIRYNFNPNDSARLRKDVDMGSHLRDENLTPVYLVFSSISPRQDAISRLTKSGWNFLIGKDAVSFINELLEINLSTILQQEEIKKVVDESVSKVMSNIFHSYAFKEASKDYYEI